jgi:hypothetical protein
MKKKQNKTPWAEFPALAHLPSGELREKLEARVRLKKVRYMLYRLRTQAEKGQPLEAVEGLLPGFMAFWLGEKPAYAKSPTGQRVEVPGNKNRLIAELGGYKSFAQVWDVDDDLMIYLRHASVWQEWNAVLHRVVPVIGDM